MRKRLNVLCCLWFCSVIAFGVRGAPAEEVKPADLSVEASGLRVIAPFKNADEALNAFGSRTPGTTVTLMISSPSSNFVSFDTAESKIAVFTDDKGNDLLAKLAGPSPQQGTAIKADGFSFFPLISKDAHACAVDVNAALLPAKGCATIKLAGSVVMLCASAKREFVQKDIPVKDGSKLEADGIKLSFYQVGKPLVGAEPLSITLHAHEDISRIADVKFFTANGVEIASRSMGAPSKMAVLSSLTVDWTFNLAQQADAVTMKLYLWSDLQKKTQTFELNIGAGL